MESSIANNNKPVPLKTSQAVDEPDLPSIDLILEQSGWLAPARQWLFQQITAKPNPRILDLGCGFGAVSGELLKLTAGMVFALDHNLKALQSYPSMFRNIKTVCARAPWLPFAYESFDLVFCQLALLWMPVEQTLQEVARILVPGGYLIALEPEYGGMIEHPEEIAIQEIWERALERAGADPHVGRKLPGILEKLGLQVKVNLFNELAPPAPGRFDLLGGLPLTPQERQRLNAARIAAFNRTERWQQVSHLPYFLVTARLGD